LEKRAGLGTRLYQIRTLREGYLLREAAEIDFPIWAWIDLRREALASRGDIIHEQRLGRNGGGGLHGDAVALQTPYGREW
jgi:hypothetical protein